MAAAPRTRARARELYVAGYSADETARRVRVGESTVKRWAKEGGWTEARRRRERLEALAPQLAEHLLAAAADSLDPQQSFAALNAAKAAGLRKPEQPHPEPAVVARALISVLDAHPVLGPPLRRHRAEVVRLVVDEVAGMEHLS